MEEEKRKTAIYFSLPLHLSPPRELACGYRKLRVGFVGIIPWAFLVVVMPRHPGFS